MRFILGPFMVLSFILGACQTSQSALIHNRCMTLAVLPPEHSDERTSEYIATQWIKEMKRQNAFKSCDKVLHPVKLRDLYQSINISHRQRQAASQLSEAQRSALQTLGNADHVASLKYRYKRGSLTLDASIYQLREGAMPLRNALTQAVVVEEIEPSYFVSDAGRSFGLFLTQLVPTAISLGGTSNELPNMYTEENADQRYYELDKEKRSLLPIFIGSIRLENIDSRSGYGAFDSSLRLVPYLSVTSHDLLFTYATKAEFEGKNGDRSRIQSFPYSLEFYGITPALLLEGALYTSGGTFLLGLGGGPAFTYFSDSQDNTNYDTDLSGIVRLGYRAFLTDRCFFQVIYEMQTFRDQIHNEYFRSDSNFFVVGSIGYLFPELQRMFRNSVLD